VEVPFLGDRLLAHRPPGGYGSNFELQRAVSFDAAMFRRFRDFVTVHSWSNAVALPVPLSERKGHGKDRLLRPIRQPLRLYDPNIPETESRFPWYCAVWSLDSLKPLQIRTADRSPININTASRQVLISVLDGLEGFFLLDRRRPVPYDMFYQFLSHSYGYSPELSLRTTSWPRKGSELGYLYRTAAIDARKVADEILARRPFRSRHEFNQFADDLVMRGVLKDDRPVFFDYQRTPEASICRTYSADQAQMASRAMADVLKANFSPSADKANLLVHSTEFCFSPMGTFEIRSEGMKLRETTCLARSRHQAVVNLFRPVWSSVGDQLSSVSGPIGNPLVYSGEEFYAELHSMRSFAIPEFRRRATFSFWVKPSWDPRNTGKIRTLITLDDMIVTGKDPKGPLPFGLYFLPSWHGPSEPTGRYRSPAPRSSLLWAVGVKGKGGHAVSVPAKLEANRWSHVIVSCEAEGELSLTVNGERFTTNVMVHVPRLPRNWIGQYAPVVRLGGELSELGTNPQHPRNYFADAWFDEFQAWFDDPRGYESALRQYEVGRFKRRGSVSFDLPAEAIAVSWSVEPSERVETRVFVGDEEVSNPGWSPIGSGKFAVRFDDRGREPLRETPRLVDWIFFVSEGRSKFISYCAVDVP
jgi:hypothetical protein